MAKNLQFLRNKTLFENKIAALNALKSKLIGAEFPLAAGEPLIACYNEIDGKINILFALSMGDNINYQIFEGSKIKDDGTLEIPQNILDTIKVAINNIIGGATEGYDTLGKIETLIKNLQAELDATQTGAGLGTDGSYTSETNSNYINDAQTLKEADKLLDTALKAEEIVRISKDEELERELDTLAATVTKNQVTAGLGITVNTEGANTVVSAKVKTEGNALKVDEENGLYVDESVLEKYQGAEAIAVSEVQGGFKTISLTIDPSDNVLTQSEKGLLSTLSLKYIKRQTGETQTPAKLQLLGKDEIVITELNVNDFVMDGMLANVALEGNNLTFTFNTDAGSKELTVDLSNYIDVYNAGDGIFIEGKNISARIDTNSENFLTVSTDGIKLDGVEAAINQAEADAIATIKGTANVYPTLGDVENKLDGIDTELADIDAYTVNTKPINESPILNGADIKLDGYVQSVATNEALNIATTDTVNQAFGKLEKAILDNEEVCSKAFDAIKTSVGLGENLEYVAAPGSNYIKTATSVQNADAYLDAAIKAVDDKVAAEVDKAYLDGVVAGSGIDVTEKANNKQTISAKTVDTDPIIEVTENGIGSKTDAVWDCGEY